MLRATHREAAPWTLVDFNDQRLGRLTLVRNLLDRLPDTRVDAPLPELPKLKGKLHREHYDVKPIEDFPVEDRGWSAGLHPAPAQRNGNGNSNSGHPRDGGAGGHDRWRHGWRHRAPWTGLRRVYPPNRPASDRSLRLLVGVDLGRHICQISKWNRGQIRFPAESGSDPINPIGLAGVGSCLGQSP
jgi:hypothetical protein